MSELAPFVRVYYYVKELGTTEDKIESFISNMANSPEPDKLIDVANQIAQLSRSESIPLEDQETHVKQKEEEMQMLEEMKQRCAISDSTNVEIQTINDYKQLIAELSNYHLSFRDSEKTVTVLNNIKYYRYDQENSRRSL